jgi:phage replication O-like protein O
MAAPQTENGYTKIANEILEALAQIRIPGETRQVLDVIFRKTYGFNKKEDKIPLSQFSLATGMKKPTCSRAINKALSMNLIIKKENGFMPIYRFNKDYNSWKPLSKKRTLSKKIPSKEIKEKRNISPQILELSNLLAEKILINNPKHTRLSNGKREETVIRWSAAIDKLHRLDNQTIEDIQTVIKWSQGDSFWKNNILSGDKLREKWDQLYPKAIEARNKNSWMEA